MSNRYRRSSEGGLEVVSDPQRIPDETFEGGTFAQQACWQPGRAITARSQAKMRREPLQDGEPTTDPS